MSANPQVFPDALEPRASTSQPSPTVVVAPIVDPAAAKDVVHEVAREQRAARLTDHLETAAEVRLDWFIFTIMTLILGFLSVLLYQNLIAQRTNYREGITIALGDPIDHAAALTYARASDAAVMKLSALFLGFLLIFTGALYVLRNATAQYKLRAKGVGHSGGLQTSSPGLVVVTLGVLLVGTALVTVQQIDYKTDPSTLDIKPAETIAPGQETALPTTATLKVVPQ